MGLQEALVGLSQQRGVNRHCQTHEIFALPRMIVLLLSGPARVACPVPCSVKRQGLQLLTHVLAREVAEVGPRVAHLLAGEVAAVGSWVLALS